VWVVHGPGPHAIYKASAFVRSSTLAMRDGGCAIGEDGELLSPSKISFFHDVDDADPLLAVPSCSSSSSLPSGPIRGSSQNAFSMLLHHAGHKPALVAAGSRRSGRVIKPSEKLGGEGHRKRGMYESFLG
jgi:hypothetical protein